MPKSLAKQQAQLARKQRKLIKAQDALDEKKLADKDSNSTAVFSSPVSKSKNLWFIADFPLDKSIKAQLSNHYSSIQEFEAKSFANVSPFDMLNENQVCHMWTNTRIKKAHAYVQQFVKQNSSYTTVLVHRSSMNAKHQKWVHELMAVDGAIDIKMSKKDIGSISSLNVDGLIDQLDDQIVLHPPASFLGMLMSVSSAVRKKTAR
jgi:hypothetical protein